MEPRREDGLVAMVTNRWESTILVILSCTTATVRPVSLQISRGHWIHPRGNVYKVSSGCTISSADFSIHIFIYFSSYLTFQHLQCAVHRECHSNHNLKRECRENDPQQTKQLGLFIRQTSSSIVQSRPLFVLDFPATNRHHPSQYYVPWANGAKIGQLDEDCNSESNRDFQRLLFLDALASLGLMLETH